MTLTERIAARINGVLDATEYARISAPTAARGLAYGGPDHPEIVLTVDEIARIAAGVAEDV